MNSITVSIEQRKDTTGARYSSRRTTQEVGYLYIYFM